MNKELLTKQLQLIKNVPPGENCEFTEEGAGVLRSFVNARKKLPDLSKTETALHSKIMRLITNWENTCKVPNPPQPTSPDQRSQLVLRAAIDKVMNGNMASLSSDEAALLRGSYTSLSARPGTGSTERLQTLLTKVIQKLDEAASPNGSESSIFEDKTLVQESSPEKQFANEVNSETDFGDISKTPFKILAGIDVNINVRQFEFVGNTLIAGDVPKDVLVKVIDGSLQVNGFVAGNLLVDEDIQVDGNIQGGIVISLFGSIGLDRCLMGTRLIALKGNVNCNHLEAPHTAFAWDTIHVDGAVLSGKVYGGNIEIKGKAVSTEFYCSGQVNVDRVETGTRGPCTIFLNSLLTCEDYGRFMDKSDEEKQRRVTELNTQIVTCEQLDQYTHTMIHNSYRTGLFYLLGGVDSASSAMNLQGMQSKAMYLEQVVALSESITNYTRAELENESNFNIENFEDFVRETQETFKMISKDIQALPDEFGSTHRRFLLDRCDEFKAFARKVGGLDDVEEIKFQVITLFTKILSSWRGTLGEVKRDIQELIEQFGLPEETLHKIEHAPETLDNMLDETIENIHREREIQAIQRAKSPLIRLLRESADRYARNIEASHTKIQRYRKEVKDIKAHLQDDSVVLYGETGVGSCTFSAQYCGDGTVISSSRNQRTGRDTHLAKTIVLESTVEESVEFERLDNLVQRKTA